MQKKVFGLNWSQSTSYFKDQNQNMVCYNIL